MKYMFLLVVIGERGGVLDERDLIFIMGSGITVVCVFLRLGPTRCFLEVGIVGWLFLFHPCYLRRILGIRLIIYPFERFLRVRRFLMILASGMTRSPRIGASSTAALAVGRALRYDLFRAVELVGGCR